jgi:hypothetical protein
MRMRPTQVVISRAPHGMLNEMLIREGAAMRSAYRNAFRILLLVGAIGISMVPFGSQAQQSGQLTPQQFQANPAQILASYPDGGPLLISLIRELAVADQADLPLIIGLLANANVDQANAIGTGLGQAALASVTTNQAYANAIQIALAAANNQTASLAYAAVMGGQTIGATGAGGGGGGGGGGPVNPSTTGGGGGGGGSLSLSTSTRTTPTNFFTSNFNGSASTPASVSQSVSQTR